MSGKPIPQKDKRFHDALYGVTIKHGLTYLEVSSNKPDTFYMAYEEGEEKTDKKTKVLDIEAIKKIINEAKPADDKTATSGTSLKDSKFTCVGAQHEPVTVEPKKYMILRKVGPQSSTCDAVIVSLMLADYVIVAVGHYHKPGEKCPKQSPKEHRFEINVETLPKDAADLIEEKKKAGENRA